MRTQKLRTVLTGIAVAGFAVSLLAGCSTGSTLVAQSNEVGHILLSESRHADAVSDDEIEGTLTLVGSCLGFDTGLGDFVAVFPQGSGIIERTDQVEIPGWGTLAIDDHYQGPGRILRSSTLSYQADFPEECAADRVIVLDPLR